MSLSCFQWRQPTEQNTLKEIDMSSSGLDHVPIFIFMHERTLQTLLLNSNSIQDVTLSICHCLNLTLLNLSDNKISALPNGFRRLVNLKTLDLSRNCFEEISESIKGCKKLSVLNLSVNPFKQFPDVITQLISLEELYLNDISLECLPANVGRLVQLRILELRDNDLSTLPRALARFNKLTRLDIGHNDFTRLPDVIGQLHDLQELWIDQNGIMDIPPFIGNLKKLTHLDVDKNYIEKIPAEIGKCCQLQVLSLSSNNISETLPQTIAALTSLITLKMEKNYFRELPQAIGNLVNLEELYASKNRLMTVPSSIGLLRKLLSLGLDCNLLECLPPEIGSCARLRVLTIQDNLLESIPPEIGNLHNLTVLNLTDNNIRFLPMSMEKLRNLKALWLVYNQSKPLTAMVKSYDRMTSSMALTCCLLPQGRPASHHEYLPREESSTTTYKQKTTTRLKIRFSFNPIQERPYLVFRSPTPYPKKLKELAKCAKAITPQASSSNGAAHEQDELPVVNPMVDQVKTAIVKKHSPTMVKLKNKEDEETATPNKTHHQPPPYHIAATFSKQASFFQKDSYVNKEERRTDLDTNALSTLKDELLHHLPSTECQMSQSEQSGSVEIIYPGSAEQIHCGQECPIAMSDVDSAFVDNIELNYKNVEQNVSDTGRINSSSHVENDGTYSACPGIVITENSPSEPLSLENGDCLPYDSSNHPISKVNSWLSSKTKSPVNSEHFLFMNMYPCENNANCQNDSNQNIQESNAHVSQIGTKQGELITSSEMTTPSKLPWLFGIHRNPKVIEVTLLKTGHDLGFEIIVMNSGVYVKSVSEANQTLKEGDKILQINGIDVNSQFEAVNLLSSVKAKVGPYTMMISRQS